MPAPPPLRQRQSDNSALACVRMILAHAGKELAEGALEQAVGKQRGGIAIDDVAVLASQFGHEGEIGTFALNDLSALIAGNTYPIVYLNRVHLDDRSRLPRKLAQRRCVVGAVVPVKVKGQFVWLNDPRSGKMVKVSRRKFESARGDLGNWCVVCRPLTRS